MKTAVKLTYNDYVLTPEGTRYELLDGELFMTPAPSPFHQRIIGRLFSILAAHVQGKGLGEVFLSPVDVLLSRENVVQPDILFIDKSRMGIVSNRGIEGAPDLVVEILSPSSRVRDLELKRRLYGQYGVREYWIADPEARTLEVAVLGDAGLETHHVHPAGNAVSSPLFPGLSFDPKGLFT